MKIQVCFAVGILGGIVSCSRAQIASLEKPSDFRSQNSDQALSAGASTCPSLSLQPVNVYVSPSGSSANCGSLNAPLATIDQARQMVRSFNRSQIAAPIYVNLRGGQYPISHSVLFDGNDSGQSLANPIYYRAYLNESPIISSGVAVTNWSPDPQNSSRWKAALPAGLSDIRHLYVNGNPAIRARTPNLKDASRPWLGSYFHVNSLSQSSPAQLGADSNNPEGVWTDGFMHNSANPSVSLASGTAAVLDPLLATMPASHVDGVELYYNRQDNMDMYPIKSYQPTNNSLHTPARIFFDPLSPSVALSTTITAYRYNSQSFFLENALEFLDSPGEWFFDRPTRMVYYFPLPGENMATAEVMAPRLENLFVLIGTSASPVKYITFDSLQFQHTDWLLPGAATIAGYSGKNGLVNLQGGILTYPGAYTAAASAVTLASARSVVFKGCVFKNLGGSGVALQTDTQYTRILGSTFQNIGVDGVDVDQSLHYFLPETGNTSTPTAVRYVGDSVGDTIENNSFTSFGRDMYGGGAVFAEHATTLSINYNRIHNGPFSGVSLGFQYRLDHPAGIQAQVIGNEISGVLGQMVDGGAIYTLGDQSGALISNNYIHDVSFAQPGDDRLFWNLQNFFKGVGIYLDTSSEHIGIENNYVSADVDDVLDGNSWNNSTNSCLNLGNPSCADFKQTVVNGGFPKPSVISWGPARIDAFYRTEGSFLGHQWYDGIQYRSEILAPAGAPGLNSAPSAVSWTPGRLDVFYKTSNNLLGHQWFDGQSWKGEQLSPSGSPLLAGDPSAVSWTPNRLDVFYRTPEGLVGHQWFDPNPGRWQGEALAPAGAPKVQSDVAAITRGSYLVDLYYQSDTNTLGHQWFYPGAPRWSGEVVQPGLVAVGSTPSVVSWGVNRMDVFYSTPSAGVGHQWFDPSFGWEIENVPLSAGLSSLGAPSVVSWAPGRLDVFLKSKSLTLNHAWYPIGGTGWLSERLPGNLALISAPAAVTLGQDLLDIFYTGAGSPLPGHSYFNRGWYAPVNLQAWPAPPRR